MATQYTAGLAQGQKLTADIMNQLGAVSVSFNPIWTSSGTQPAIGNGTLSGRYFQFQKYVVVQFLLLAGTTTTFGTGTYYFSIPSTARAGIYGYMTAGVTRVYDQSAATAYMGQTIFYGGTTTVTAQMSGGLLGQTFPMTFANMDEIIMNYWYEAA